MCLRKFCENWFVNIKFFKIRIYYIYVYIYISVNMLTYKLVYIVCHMCSLQETFS